MESSSSIRKRHEKGDTSKAKGKKQKMEDTSVEVEKTKTKKRKLNHDLLDQ